MRTETLWILVALGIILFVAVMAVATRRNKDQSSRDVQRSERGARELREEIERDDRAG